MVNGRITNQLYKDFCENKTSVSPKTVIPIMKGQYIMSNLNEVLPSEIKEAIKEAMPVFGKKISGYDREDALLAAVESRTSSPVRIVRNERLVSSVEGIYPCGEGAGYAGGITTAAIDGVKVAEKIAQTYKSEETI